MKKIIILCIATSAFISNHTMFSMFTNKCRTLTKQIAFSTKFHKHPSDVNYPALLRDLEADKFDIEQKIQFVKEMIHNDINSNLSDSEKTIIFRSEDRLDNRNK